MADWPTRISGSGSPPPSLPSRERRARRAAIRLLALAGLALIPFVPAPAPARVLAPTPAPLSTRRPALPALAVGSISDAIGRDQPAYHAKVVRSLRGGPHAPQGSTGVVFENAVHGFAVALDSKGLLLRRGDDRFGLALVGFGRGAHRRAIAATAPEAQRNRVVHRRGVLTEWYSNGPRGLEQGFTLTAPPGRSKGGPLDLELEISGNFEVSLAPDARSLSLARRGGARLEYAGLAAVDARGAALPAWLELDGRRMRLRVDDSGAAYPVTIDPVLGAVKLTSDESLCPIGGACERGHAGDRFGFSVAISNDGATVAVAAPHATGSNADSGAVYVFRRPGFGGWNGCVTIGCLDFDAKLRADVVLHGFGASVAISGDGNTIAVLVDTLGSVDPQPGTVWLYQKPPTGWASTSQKTAILSLFTTEKPCGPVATDPLDCLASDFSTSIDVNGDGSTVVLGYSGGIRDGVAKGSAYVFFRPATGWVSTNIDYVVLRRQGGGVQHDLFGQAVAISDDDSTIVVAAPQANGSLGAVDVFVKGGTSWTQYTLITSAELTYAPGDGLSFLGNGVDVSSDGATVVVGGNGRALVFGKTTSVFCNGQGLCHLVTAWADAHERAILSTSDGSPVAWPRISGDGSRIVASGFESPGMLYSYLRPGSAWASATQSARFGTVDGAPGDLLGYTSNLGAPAIALSADGATLLAGASGATIAGDANRGAAYLFLPEPAVTTALAAGAALLAGIGAGAPRTSRDPRGCAARP